MADILGNSVPNIYWTPFCVGTRKIGATSGDVTTDEYLDVSVYKNLGFNSTTPNDYDISRHKPAPVKTITLIGLPVNQVSSASADGVTEMGFGGDYNTASAAGKLTPSALDAYYLLKVFNKDWKTKPSSFRVQGGTGNVVYGAIVGMDDYGNPAPFATNAITTFVLKDAGGGVDELGKTTGTWSSAFEGTNIQAISTTQPYQAFLPFAITPTAADGSTKAVDSLYIEKAYSGSTWSGHSELTSSLYGNIDSSSEGVSYYVQDFIRAITPTTAFPTTFSGQEAGTDEEFLAAGIAQGSSSDRSFEMRGITYKGAQIKFAPKGNLTGYDTYINMPADSDNIATVEAALCTQMKTVSSASNVAPAGFIGLVGTSKGTYAIQAISVTSNMTAADPGDIEPGSIQAYIGTAPVLLDDEEDHDTVQINAQAVQVADGFGNIYSSIEDADLNANTYLVADNGSATSTAFPGAKADFNSNYIEVGFDLAQVKAGQSKAAVTVSTDDGSPKGTVTLDLYKVTDLSVEAAFTPVEGVVNHPYLISFVDQNGTIIPPVRLNTGVNTLTVEVEADDNGTTSASAEESITSSAYELVRTAKLNTGKKSMTVTGSSDYGDKTLIINPSEADLEKPVIIVPLVAIDCGFEITITDNIDVDAAGTTVTVKNASGEDITSTLLQSVASDNGTTAVIQIKGTGTGSFSVSITAKDAAGSEQTSTQIISVTTATDCAISAECLSVAPAYVSYGDAATDITITGKNTNFVQGTTAVDFSCAAVTEGAVTVNSATELTVSVTVPETGETEDCDITVTTGDETITCADLFQVVAGIPCTDADGDGYGEGCTAGTDCDDNNSAVNPGAAEVCDDSIDNDCDGAIDDADTDCEVEPTCTITLSKTSARAGFILPRLLVLSITGSGDDFSTSASVSFSAGVTKLLQIPGSGKITVIGLIKASAKGSTVTVSVAGCDGTADLTIN